MVGLPRRFRLRGIEFRIVVRKRPDEFLPDDLRGRVDMAWGLIAIDGNQNLDCQWQTLWHEIFHVLLMGVLDDGEEYVIDELASWVLEVGRQIGLYG